MRRRPRTFKALSPNAGIEAAYRRKIDAMVRKMADSTLYWVRAGYRANEPKALMAQDAKNPLPSKMLKKIIADLKARWQKQFDEAAPKLADYFATAVEDRTDKALRKILRDGGFSVRFTMTRAQQDIIGATITENVSLIKSIPSQYFTQIESMVMQSVTRGRDLGPLAKSIEKQYGVTKRRAALIARDQNNKATSALEHNKRDELGLNKSVWMHSGGGKHPRPDHVRASGTEYDTKRGCLISGEYIFPGQLINCRCRSRAVIPGF